MIYSDSVRVSLTIFLLALAPRVALVLSWDGADPGYSDASYQRMAESYAEGYGLGMPDVYPGAGRIFVRAFRPPLFPFLWGLVYPWTGGWFTPIRLAHAVLSALTCVLVFFVGKRLLDRHSALLGALLCAFYPAQIWHGVNLMTEPLFIFFLVLTVLLLFILQDRPRTPIAFAAGVTAALGVLSRSVLIGFVPLCVLWVARKGRRAFPLAAVFLAGFLCAMTPWWVRNWQIFHRFVLTTTDGGHGFLIGNNERSRSDPRGVYVPERWDFAREAIHDEIALQQRLYQQGLRFIAAHPGEWALLAIDKFCRFWRFYPHAEFVGSRNAIIYGVSYTMVFPFIVAGIILSFRAMPERRGLFTLIYILICYMTGIHMIFIAVMRYREPLMPFLLCFAGYAMVRLWGYVRALR